MSFIRYTGTDDFQENCYFLVDEETGIAAVIDPGFADARVLGACENWDVRMILLTHGHFDHIGGVQAVREKTGAPVACYAAEAKLLGDASMNGSLLLGGDAMTLAPDVLLSDGQALDFCRIPVRVLHTPGHTAGSCCYITPEAIFAGDTVIYDSVGRTDLPTGDAAALAESIRKCAALSGDPAFCCGHGPAVTLEWIKAHNPYFRPFLAEE